MTCYQISRSRAAADLAGSRRAARRRGLRAVAGAARVRACARAATRANPAPEAAPSGSAALPAPKTLPTGGEQPLTVYTFGDSVLDCGHYNDAGLTPGQLLVRNDDRLFSEFQSRDLRSRHAGDVRLDHRAVDGATVAGLERQLGQTVFAPSAIALLSVGGNDLLQSLAGDRGPGVQAFAVALRRFVRALPVRPLLMATVYDPTFGDDCRNFLPVDARTARANG